MLSELLLVYTDVWHRFIPNIQVLSFGGELFHILTEIIIRSVNGVHSTCSKDFSDLYFSEIRWPCINLKLKLE